MKIVNILYLVPLLVLSTLVTPSAYATAAINFSTGLTGSEEVPPVASTGTGFFTATLDATHTQLAFTETVSGLNFSTITASHIHVGPFGVNGPVILFLFNRATEGTFPGTKSATLTAANLIPRPAQGVNTFADAINKMLTGNAYVNVHTDAHPGGEIRGQIEAQQISISKFFTDSNVNPLPTDQFGNPKVDVVLANGRVRSTNPGQVLAWIRVTNTGGVSIMSLLLNETLPVDWTAHPPWLPAEGAIHVFFQLVNGTRLEITDPTGITASTGNPETVLLSIPDISSTAAGKSLGTGESILLSVKLSYALRGTSQSANSFPRNYTDVASAAAFTGTSFTGTSSSGSISAFFVAYAKVVGDVDGNFQVNIIDASLLALSFEARPGDARWSADADFDYNRVIDILDAAQIASYYGTSS